MGGEMEMIIKIDDTTITDEVNRLLQKGTISGGETISKILQDCVLSMVREKVINRIKNDPEFVRSMNEQIHVAMIHVFTDLGKQIADSISENIQEGFVEAFDKNY